VEAVSALSAKSFLLDGESIVSELRLPGRRPPSNADRLPPHNRHTQAFAAMIAAPTKHAPLSSTRAQCLG
jgi:hypothetical protein